MIYKVKKRHSRKEVLSLMEPDIRDWFESKFHELTEPQHYAVPLIHERKNVLVSSPTGSGKTMTAFLSIINELFKLDEKGELDDRIYCVYISPLKALANDINKNLKEPLKEIEELAKKKGKKSHKIRVGVRSGDTSQAERQRMARKPPHIFITTPESLSLVLSAPKFREKFYGVEYLIVDEIHEVCSSKRGVHLSLTLERLQENVEKKFTRIGLSATQAPIEEIAKFLVGYKGNRLRDAYIVEADTDKKLDLRVLCPVDDMTAYSADVINAKMYDQLKELIDKNRTTLIFTNTRSGTEQVSFKLSEREVGKLAAHHGSLSKHTRIDVEDRLKNGELKAVISSTSLELGIDIGYIDQVVQIGSPKSVAKGVQRIGRAGHSVRDTSCGRIVVFDNDDLIECAVLANNAVNRKIDRVDTPTNSLDVLAQSVVGMSLEKRWDVAEALFLIKRSYCYHKLKKRDFIAVLRYLSGYGKHSEEVYSKIWYDEEEGVFGRKKSSRMIYNLNVGTIPEETSYKVFSEKGIPLGGLSEKFVERLSKGDIFILGGKSYEFLKAKGMRVFVKNAAGRKPTVPLWTGEMMPRSFDLSVEVGKFREEIAKKLSKEKDHKIVTWLMKNYCVDKGSARTIISHCREQVQVMGTMPSHRNLGIEGYVDLSGYYNAILHFPFGRRVNDALSRAYAYVLSNKFNCNIRVSVTDDNFMLTFPKRVNLDDMKKVVRSDELEQVMKKAIRETEMFKQRFRHAASRSLMVLRNYKGREVSVSRQQLRSSRVLDILHGMEDFPVIKEAYNEILNEVMDLKHGKEVLKGIESGKVKVRTTGFKGVASPFAHNVILAGISDVILMEDKTALLKELHRQVLRKIMPDSELEAFRFEAKFVDNYFREKMPRILEPEDILETLEGLGTLHLFRQKGVNVSDFSDLSMEALREMAVRLLNNGMTASVWTGEVTWTLPEFVGDYQAVYGKKVKMEELDKRVLKSIGKKALSPKEISEKLKTGPKRVRDSLKKLEEGYFVERVGFVDDGFLWKKRRKKDRDITFKSAAKNIIRRHISYNAPLTSSEIALGVRLKEKEVLECLDDLEEGREVESGQFVIGSGRQYMLSEDLTALESRHSGVNKFDENIVDRFKEEKLFRRYGDIDGYFDTFGQAGLLLDIFRRIRGFDIRKWFEKRVSEEIIQGRFAAGRVCYVLKKDAEKYIRAYRKEGLNRSEKRILDVIENGEGLTMNQLLGRVKVEKEELKSILDKLDRNLYVARKFAGREGWASKNSYVALRTDLQAGEIGKDETYLCEAEKEIVEKVLKGHGPLPDSGIRRLTRFHRTRMKKALDKLREEGTAEKILVKGHSETEMWILKDDLEMLKGFKGPRRKGKLRVLSLYDPAIQGLWARIASEYGDSWFYPVVKNGELLGTVEIWEISGCVEIRDISLNDDTLLKELVKELDSLIEYFGQMGYDVVRVKEVFGKEVGELKRSELDVFEKNGYTRIQDWLVKGRAVPQTFELDDVLKYVFVKQHIEPSSRFEDTMRAAAALGGLRSDFEARLRTQESSPLSKLKRMDLLYAGHGIPPYLTYMTKEDCSLYKLAKHFVPDEHMDAVLRVIEDKAPVSRKKVAELSILGHGNTAQALRRLYAGTYIVRNAENKIIPVGAGPDNEAGRETAGSARLKNARKEVLKRIIGNFGIFSAENLSAYTKFGYKMAETRKLLRELEDEGFLVKGYLIRGDGNLYWMLKEDLEALEDVEFERSFVLSSDDNLYSYLSLWLRDRLGKGQNFIIFDGTDIVGTFKGRKRKNELIISDFQGDSEELARVILKTFSLDNRVRVVEEERDRIDDWEIIQWWEKTRGKSCTEKIKTGMKKR